MKGVCRSRSTIGSRRAKLDGSLSLTLLVGVALSNMPQQITRSIATCVVTLAMACGNDQTARQEAPDLVERQATFYSRTSDASPWLWVLIVDDAPTTRARLLRQQVAEKLIGWLDQVRSESCVEADDVAVYLPVNLKVLIVPSSDPRAALHGGIVEDLDLDLANGTSETGALWESTVASSIQNLESDVIDDNDLFSSAMYWDELLRGEQLPEREEDSNFLSSIGENTHVDVFVATSRDDSSPFEFRPLDFGSALPPNWRVLVSPSSDCSSSDETEFMQVAQWGGGLLCDQNLFRYGLVCDYGLDCVSTPPIALAEGQVACRILAYADPGLSCPKDLGWFDPVDIEGERRPLLGPDPHDPEGGVRRVCEIVQLSDQALRSCQIDIDCEGCAPGWCLREPFAESWDWRAQMCAEESAWNVTQIRLVNGSSSAADALLTIQCSLDVRSEGAPG